MPGSLYTPRWVRRITPTTHEVKMGREVRRVPADWEHPRRSEFDDRFQPMYDEDYPTACKEWKEGYKEYEANPKDGDEYWDWNGMPPDVEYYHPV